MKHSGFGQLFLWLKGKAEIAQGLMGHMEGQMSEAHWCLQALTFVERKCVTIDE